MPRHHKLVKAYDAPEEIQPFRIASHGASPGQAKQATGAGDTLFGVSGDLGGVADSHADVVEAGLAEVEYGAAVSRGDFLTADAQGRAVPAAAGNRVIGEAKTDGAEGDIGSLKIALSQMPA